MALKNCPFCEGKADTRIQYGSEWNGYGKTVTIFCTDCRGSMTREDRSPKRGGYALDTAKKECADAWNTRP